MKTFTCIRECFFENRHFQEGDTHKGDTANRHFRESAAQGAAGAEAPAQQRFSKTAIRRLPKADLTMYARARFGGKFAADLLKEDMVREVLKLEGLE